MEQKTQHGYLVLADICGYTSYVARTELEHSHAILTELLELLVGRLTAVLTLAKLEGDAVFAHCAETRLPRGETLLELIEETYVGFRERTEGMRRATTCTCNACRAIPSLDLKFLAHHGDYMIQNVAGVTELVGSDVNLVHRLLKNTVGQATGWQAYALFTEAGLEHMGVRPEGLHSQSEEYEHLGPVLTHSLDLRRRHEEILAARRVVVAPQDAEMRYSVDIAAPREVVWQWLNDAELRNRWMGPDVRWSVAQRPAGRTTAGTVNHCAHGKDFGALLVETVLDLRPFEYMTVERHPMPQVKTIDTIRLEPIPGGTRLTVFTRCETRYPTWLTRRLYPLMVAKVMKMPEVYAELARQVAAAG